MLIIMPSREGNRNMGIRLNGILLSDLDLSHVPSVPHNLSMVDHHHIVIFDDVPSVSHMFSHSFRNIFPWFPIELGTIWWGFLNQLCNSRTACAPKSSRQVASWSSCPTSARQRRHISRPGQANIETSESARQTMGKPWENHRKMVISWGNHRKTRGKWWSFMGRWWFQWIFMGLDEDLATMISVATAHHGRVRLPGTAQ